MPGIQIDFPLTKGWTGYFKSVPTEDSLQGRLLQLLLTMPGERVMLTSFGVGVQRYLFEPLDNFTLSSLQARISQQVALYEPRVNLLKVTATADYSDVSMPTVTITMDMETPDIPGTVQYAFTVKGTS